MNDRGVPSNGRERPGRRYPGEAEASFHPEGYDDRRNPQSHTSAYEDRFWVPLQEIPFTDALIPLESREHHVEPRRRAERVEDRAQYQDNHHQFDFTSSADRRHSNVPRSEFRRDHQLDDFFQPDPQPQKAVNTSQPHSPYKSLSDQVATPERRSSYRSSPTDPDNERYFHDQPRPTRTAVSERDMIQLTAVMPPIDQSDQLRTCKGFDPFAISHNVWQEEDAPHDEVRTTTELRYADIPPANPPMRPTTASGSLQPRRGIPETKKRPYARRHPLIFSFLTVLLIVGILGGGYFIKMFTTVNKAIDQIKHQDLMPSEAPALPEPDGMPMVMALFGTDHRPEEAGRDEGERSDTIMVAYLPADRKKVYLISIPRDYFVEIPVDPKDRLCGYPCKSKINASYAWGKTQLAVKTIQNLLGVDVNHIGIINCGDFIKLSEVLDGIEVDNPVESYSAPYNAQGNQWHWPKGKITIRGEEALAFVRQRKGLGVTPDNNDDPANKDPSNHDDFGRAKRQRMVLTGIAQKMLSAHVLTDSAKAEKVIGETARLITVDSGFSSQDIRNAVLAMRITSSSDVKQLAAPVLRTGDEPGVGNVLYPDMEALEELSIALKTDKMQDYYEKHKDDPAIGRKN